jgi:hypothetical protein
VQRREQANASHPVRRMVSMALFIWLIIRLIHLVFQPEQYFSLTKKSANSVFQSAYNSSRTAPMADKSAGAVLL